MKCLFYILVVHLYSIGGVHDHYWREYKGSVPSDGFPASKGVYVAQVVKNGIVPGTIYARFEQTVTEADGGRYVSLNFSKVLCSEKPKQLKWQKIDVGTPLPYSSYLVPGGVENGQPLFIGRVYHEEICKVGKVYPRSNTMKIWTMGGGSETLSRFEVLTYVDGEEDGGNGEERSNSIEVEGNQRGKC